MFYQQITCLYYCQPCWTTVAADKQAVFASLSFVINTIASQVLIPASHTLVTNRQEMKLDFSWLHWCRGIGESGKKNLNIRKKNHWERYIIGKHEFEQKKQQQQQHLSLVQVFTQHFLLFKTVLYIHALPSPTFCQVQFDTRFVHSLERFSHLFSDSSNLFPLPLTESSEEEAHISTTSRTILRFGDACEANNIWRIKESSHSFPTITSSHFAAAWPQDRRRWDCYRHWRAHHRRNCSTW